MTANIAIYSRKSKYTGKGESIDNQIELCKQYIAIHFPKCAANDIFIYEDEGFSGGNTLRPQFKRMMDDAKTKNFSAIVCYRLDRISRDIGDFARLIEELNNLQISFVSIKEQFDTSSPMGRAMMYISSVFSQLERETIAERIRDNMHELAKTGRWLGGITPTGYISESVENVTIAGKVKKVCKLKMVPEEAKIVQQVFKIFLETNSLTKTETYFLQNSYKTKNDKAFSRFAIRNILTNPVYVIADSNAYYYFKSNTDLFAQKSDFDNTHGVMAYNRTIQRSGKSNRVRPIIEWIVSVGKHEGLISGANWVQAQEYLQQNSMKSFRKPRSNVALLSGLLYCACGNYMRPKLSKSKTRGEPVFSYLCTMKEKSRSHLCKMSNVNGNILDEAVCEQIKKLESNGSEFIRHLASIKIQLTDSCENHAESLLRANLSENEKEIAVLVSSLSRATDTSAEGYIIKQINELHGKKELIKNRIAEFEGPALSDNKFHVIRQMLSDFKYTFDNMDIEQKRAAMRALIKRIEWDGEYIHIIQ